MRRTIPALTRAVLACVAVSPALISTSASAADGTWANDATNGDALWSTTTNWLSGTVPGSTTVGTINADRAIFTAAQTIETPYLDSNRRLGQISFDNAQADYNLDAAAGTILFLQNPSSGSQVVVLNGGATTIAPQIRLQTSGLTWNTGEASLTLLNGFSTNLGGTTVMTLTGSGGVRVEGTVYNAHSNPATLQLRGANNLTIAGNVANGTGTFSLASDGGTGLNYIGTVRLEGNNSFTGSITWRTGTLVFASNDAAGGGTAMTFGTSNAGASGVAVLIGGAYTMGRDVSLNGPANSATPVLGGSNTSGTAVYSGKITIANRLGGWQFTAAAGGTVDFSNEIVGSAATSGIVNKVGDGTIRFTRGAGNTYIGNTTVSAGTLLITNTSGSGTGTGAVQVTAGTFGGSGIASGAVTVSGGATLRAGNGDAAGGTLTLGGNLTLADGSIIQLVLGNGSAHSTLARTGGTWTFDGDQAFDLIGAGTVTPGQTYDNVITNLAADPGVANWQIFTPQWAGVFSYDGANVDFTTTAAPEPASLSLLALGGVAILRRRRRNIGTERA